METAPAHPYWPRSLSLPGYVSSARPGWQCAGAVAAAFAALLAAAWFLLCAAVHGGLEGFFSVRHRDLAADTGLLADIWKEYAKADSRYMTSDDFTVVMETVTAWAWGPLSFLTFLALLRDHPSRYVLQLIVSLGQLYGDVLYFGTEWLAGWTHSDPHPLYFWGYFVALNALWLLLPGALLLQAGLRLAAAQTALDRPPHKAH